MKREIERFRVEIKTLREEIGRGIVGYDEVAMGTLIAREQGDPGTPAKMFAGEEPPTTYFFQTREAGRGGADAGVGYQLP